jgi:hypothetical protein
MATDDDGEGDDRKVKEVIDAITMRELEKWFGLPSFTQLAEESPAAARETDPEMQAAIERRDKALAAVDPALLERIHLRTDHHPDRILVFDYSIHTHVAAEFGALDATLIERAGAITEPREVELPDELLDDLNECTPQALLRDLHRAELDFDKQFEIVDFAAEQRVDIVAVVREAMATRWTLPDFQESPLVESRRIYDELRAARRRSWLELLPQLRGRTVRE